MEYILNLLAWFKQFKYLDILHVDLHLILAFGPVNIGDEPDCNFQ